MSQTEHKYGLTQTTLVLTRLEFDQTGPKLDPTQANSSWTRYNPTQPHQMYDFFIICLFFILFWFWLPEQLSTHIRSFSGLLLFETFYKKRKHLFKVWRQQNFKFSKDVIKFKFQANR